MLNFIYLLMFFASLFSRVFVTLYLLSLAFLVFMRAFAFVCLIGYSHNYYSSSSSSWCRCFWHLTVTRTHAATFAWTSRAASFSWKSTPIAVFSTRLRPPAPLIAFWNMTLSVRGLKKRACFALYILQLYLLHYIFCIIYFALHFLMSFRAGPKGFLEHLIRCAYIRQRRQQDKNKIAIRFKPSTGYGLVCLHLCCVCVCACVFVCLFVCVSALFVAPLNEGICACACVYMFVHVWACLYKWVMFVHVFNLQLMRAQVAARDIKAGELVDEFEEKAHYLVTGQHVQSTWDEQRKQWFKAYAYPLIGDT